MSCDRLHCDPLVDRVQRDANPNRAQSNSVNVRTTARERKTSATARWLRPHDERGCVTLLTPPLTLPRSSIKQRAPSGSLSFASRARAGNSRPRRPPARAQTRAPATNNARRQLNSSPIAHTAQRTTDDECQFTHTHTMRHKRHNRVRHIMFHVPVLCATLHASLFAACCLP